MTISDQTGPVVPNGAADMPPLAAGDRARCDMALADLAEGSVRWVATSLLDRAQLLRELHASISVQAANWALTAAGIKGLDPASPLVGEEWMSGPYATLSAVATLTESVTALAAGRSPLEGVELGTAPGGRVTVPVLPRTPYEALLLHGFRAEV